VVDARQRRIGFLVAGCMFTLQLGLSLVFEVSALLLAISGGRLVAVHSGRCEITVTLAVQGTDLFVRHAHLELPGVIPVQQGIRLLPAAEYPAADNPAGDNLTGNDTAGEPVGTGPD
jgi:hypothetical protein